MPQSCDWLLDNVALATMAGDDPQHYDVVSFARQHRDWIVENRL